MSLDQCVEQETVQYQVGEHFFQSKMKVKENDVTDMLQNH